MCPAPGHQSEKEFLTDEFRSNRTGFPCHVWETIYDSCSLPALRFPSVDILTCKGTSLVLHPADSSKTVFDILTLSSQEDLLNTSML